MSVVITHPEMGVYLGSWIGLGFWSLLDPVGQQEAVTFPDETDASAHIASWDNENDPTAYSFVVVDADRSASIAVLKASGLTHLLGAMEEDALRYCEPAGHA